LASVYDVLRRRCGLSQQEAADLRGVRLDSVKSWCSDRRPAPAEAIEELRDLEAKIAAAGARYAKEVTAKSKFDGDPGERVFSVAEPMDELQAVAFGWPTSSVCLAAVAAAIAALPAGATIRMVNQDLGVGIPRAPAAPRARDDVPNPAPGGFQSNVNPEMRRPRR
jgi:hypothetical protein